jgi:hypothetical protein
MAPSECLTENFGGGKREVSGGIHRAKAVGKRQQCCRSRLTQSERGVSSPLVSDIPYYRYRSYDFPGPVPNGRGTHLAIAQLTGAWNEYDLLFSANDFPA